MLSLAERSLSKTVRRTVFEFTHCRARFGSLGFAPHPTGGAASGLRQGASGSLHPAYSWFYLLSVTGYHSNIKIKSKFCFRQYERTNTNLQQTNLSLIAIMSFFANLMKLQIIHKL